MVVNLESQQSETVIVRENGKRVEKLQRVDGSYREHTGEKALSEALARKQNERDVTLFARVDEEGKTALLDALNKKEEGRYALYATTGRDSREGVTSYILGFAKGSARVRVNAGLG
jgi:hypothetical protein